MKIKANSLGFTQQNLRDTNEKLHLIGIILTTVGALTSVASYILNQKSIEWFDASTVEQESWIYGMRSYLNEITD